MLDGNLWKIISAIGWGWWQWRLQQLERSCSSSQNGEPLKLGISTDFCLVVSHVSQKFWDGWLNPLSKHVSLLLTSVHFITGHWFSIGAFRFVMGVPLVIIQSSWTTIEIDRNPWWIMGIMTSLRLGQGFWNCTRDGGRNRAGLPCASSDWAAGWSHESAWPRWRSGSSKLGATKIISNRWRSPKSFVDTLLDPMDSDPVDPTLLK